MKNYGLAVDSLVETWLDMELYQSVSRQIDHMRMLSASLPHVAVPWVGLLISHAELIHCLWKCGETFKPSAEMQACRARHERAVMALRDQCVYLFSRMER